MTRRSKATNTADRTRQTRFRLVGGKGGVGKTTCAAALAIEAAASGQRTLVLSTDPAPSLGDALRVALRANPLRLPGPHPLYAAEVDARRVMQRWLSPRTAALEEIALRGTWLDREDVDRLLRLSLPGIDEIAGLLEMLAHGRSGRYDFVVVDTAPTGHTLRMLAMPQTLEGLAAVFDAMQSRHRAMVAALRGRWQPDAADALIEDLDRDARELGQLLADGSRLAASLVTLPEPMAVAETLDAAADLRRRGVLLDAIIVNRCVPPPDPSCAWCLARAAFERRAVRALETACDGMRNVQIRQIADREKEPRGRRALSALGRELARATAEERQVAGRPRRRRARQPAPSWPGPRVELFDASRSRLVMFGGKGGVGKTTCAAAAALEAARAAPTRRVLLLSTDPAHSLADVLELPVGDAPRRLAGAPSNLYVRELDAAAALSRVRRQYADAIDTLFDRLTSGSSMDPVYDRRILHALIDLAPPGLDELVAILEVTDALTARSRGRYDLVIMDTAPSGHALRLLEMPSAVHAWVKTLMAILLKYQALGAIGGIGAVLVRLSQQLGRLRALLTQPDDTRFIAVTRAAALPREETMRLLDHLDGAHIHAPAVVVNAIGRGTCAICARVSAAQRSELRTLRRRIASRPARLQPRLVLAPAHMPPPAGHRALARWRQHWRAPTQLAIYGRPVTR